MNYEDRKIVGIIASNVEAKIALNVIGHMSISIGKYTDKEIMGQEIITDKSGVKHLGISKFPFIITKVKQSKLKTSINNKEETELEYLGAVIYGNTKDVDEITGKFSLWRLD